MKQHKMIGLAAGLLLLAASGNASPKGDFATANGYYQAGRYETALKMYLDINRQLANWQVLYNIGNCYFKLNQPLEAKIFFLRASKYKPLDRSIAKNIAIVNRSFTDIIAPETPDFISRSIQVLQARLSLNMLSLLLLLAILLLNGFLFLLLKHGGRKKIIYGLAFSLFLSLALGAYHVQRVSSLKQTSAAVVRATNPVLRSGPGESNTELFKIHAGLEVRILDRRRDWVQVAASPQVAGWIEMKYLTLI